MKSNAMDLGRLVEYTRGGFHVKFNHGPLIQIACATPKSAGHFIGDLFLAPVNRHQRVQKISPLKRHPDYEKIMANSPLSSRELQTYEQGLELTILGSSKLIAVFPEKCRESFNTPIRDLYDPKFFKKYVCSAIKCDARRSASLQVYQQQSTVQLSERFSREELAKRVAEAERKIHCSLGKQKCHELSLFGPSIDSDLTAERLLTKYLFCSVGYITGQNPFFNFNPVNRLRTLEFNYGQYAAGVVARDNPISPQNLGEAKFALSSMISYICEHKLGVHFVNGFDPTEQGIEYDVWRGIVIADTIAKDPLDKQKIYVARSRIDQE